MSIRAEQTVQKIMLSIEKQMARAVFSNWRYSDWFQWVLLLSCQYSV